MLFGEGLAALVATITLEAVSVLSETLAGVAATMAGHCEISLSSQPTCQITKLRVSLRLRL
jgi:hypothetical protein